MSSFLSRRLTERLSRRRALRTGLPHFLAGASRDALTFGVNVGVEAGFLGHWNLRDLLGHTSTIHRSIPRVVLNVEPDRTRYEEQERGRNDTDYRRPDRFLRITP